MAAQLAPSPTLETTYKVREAEGLLDLYFYRRLGFQLAKFFAKLGMSPVGVTLLGGVFGIVAGHLYFYRNLTINIAGMALHVFANLLDNADGQLARLTGRQSREGRIIDSLVDHLIFTSIYLHLTLRCLSEGASPLIWLVALGAALSHGAQGGAADYFRNAYLHFVKQRRGDFDSSAALESDYDALNWRESPWQKFLLATYLNFTRQQEMISPALRTFREKVDRIFQEQTPDWLAAQYRDAARPAFKFWSVLMTNTRMLLLFVVLLVDRPAWFFWIEITIFNLLLLGLLYWQERMCRSLLQLVKPAPQP
ncbi:MAG TPA: CDP-alcohol phosphatidyltransferase family protein [Chthoniobacterales bacterium]